MTRGELNAQIKQLLRERHLLTAMDIVSLLEERGLVYNKTSVYRALERMLADGDICRQALGENQIFMSFIRMNMTTWFAPVAAG